MLPGVLPEAQLASLPASVLGVGAGGARDVCDGCRGVLGGSGSAACVDGGVGVRSAGEEPGEGEVGVSGLQTGPGSRVDMRGGCRSRP